MFDDRNNYTNVGKGATHVFPTQTLAFVSCLKGEEIACFAEHSVCVGDNASIQAAAQKMKDLNLGPLGENHLVGIIKSFRR